jgi:hypothetical protein
VIGLLWLLLLVGTVGLYVALSIAASCHAVSGAVTAQWEALNAHLTDAAWARAHELMKGVLDEHEYHQVMTKGFLDIHSPNKEGRIYRVRRCGGTVAMFEHGFQVLELCVQPAEPLPRGDVVLLHKLMIQGNETEYLATARRYPPLSPREMYRP